MGSAVMGVDIVGEGIDIVGVVVIVLEGKLEVDVVCWTFDVNWILMEYLGVVVEEGEVFDNGALVEEGVGWRCRVMG